MPDTIAQELDKGIDLFELYRKNNGDWAQVVLSRETEQVASNREEDGDNEFTKDELLIKFNQNTTLVEAMIKHAIETKNVRDHPSAPGVEAARLYTIVSGKKRTKVGETTDRKRLAIHAELESGKAMGVALDGLSKALPAAAPKPKPTPPKKEVSEEVKVVANLKRLDGKLTANIREALTQLNNLKGITYAYGEDALKKHRVHMQTHQLKLQDVIAKGVSAGSIELVKMQTDTEAVIANYTADVARAKRVTQAETKPKAKAKAVVKAAAAPK